MVAYLPTAQIERRVEAMWLEHDLDPCFDVERLLDALDLGLIWMPLGAHEGLPVAAELLPNVRKVLVNEELLSLFENNPPLLRFTLAHELGHWILHRGLIETGSIANGRAVDGSLTCRKADLEAAGPGVAFRLEYQASLFASHLLMPASILRAELARFGCDGWGPVYGIARAVGMSPTAVSVRLVQDGHAHLDEADEPRPGSAISNQSTLPW